MKVSIITPSYNYAHFIRQAIESSAQGGADVEHIVMDGGSSDGTREVLAEFGDKVIWRSEPDGGQSDALNKALAHATGDVIGWLNADDLYLPGAIDHVLQEFESDPDLDVLYGDTVLVDGEGLITRLYKCYAVPSAVLRWRGCTLMSTSTFFRRSVLGNEPFDTGLRMRMDWDLFLKLKLQKGAKFKYTPRPLAAFRFHENQVTHNQLDYQTPEHHVIRKRYGVNTGLVPLTRSAGIAIHRLLKLVNGAWWAEKRSAVFAGMPLLSEEGHVAEDRLNEILKSCY